MQIDGPLLHRLARRYEVAGLRASGTVWKYVERITPLPAAATLRAGDRSLRLDVAGDIVDGPLYRGEYERAELAIAARHIREGSVFVDVGANRGLYTAVALARGAAVIAVEPHPELAAELRRRFPDARVEEVAAADRVGTATLHVFANSTYMSTIRETGVDETTPVDVPVVRLDALLADLERIDLMKVDVEHLEAAVLAGASGLFERGIVRAAIVEVLIDHDRIARLLDGWGCTSRLIGTAGHLRRRPCLLTEPVASGVSGNYLVNRRRPAG